MADIFSKEKRSKIMSAIRGRDTKIEVEFRKKLWREGFRYRKNVKSYRGTPDLVLKKYKTVIFIDSCFWHGCKKHFKAPTTNPDYWKNKINNNIKRDKKVNSYYKNIGWQAIRVWDHEVKSFDYKGLKKFLKTNI